MFSKVFNIVIKLFLWLIVVLLLSYCFSGKAEAVVGSSVVIRKLQTNNPPSNCHNNYVCLKFDSKRSCVYWAKDDKGRFIQCYSTSVTKNRKIQ